MFSISSKYCSLNLVICENLLNKVSSDSKANEWVLKLNEIVNNSKDEEDRYNQNISYSEKISNNTDKLSKKLRNILLNYKTQYNFVILSFLKKINQKNYEELNDFFRGYILRNDNSQNTKNNNYYIDKSEFIPVRPPYILKPRDKPYTLVLGLDETLINFQQINYTQGMLKLRPFLIEFLDNVNQYYELILFTSETQYYAEPIIKQLNIKKVILIIFFIEKTVLK